MTGGSGLKTQDKTVTPKPLDTVPWDGSLGSGRHLLSEDGPRVGQVEEAVTQTFELLDRRLPAECVVVLLP